VVIHARENHTPLVAPGGIEHHVADLSATFAADLTLAAAQRKLADAGQWLPIDGDSRKSLGELVDCNSTGPLRLGYGAWRDLLLGAQFTNGRGELITAGGRTVKNVAGYDLTKFMVGQYGIFGQLVTITTRTYKRPTDALLATFEPDVKKLNPLLISTCRPTWALVSADSLICGYVGDAQTIDFCVSALSKHSPRRISRYAIEDDIAQREKLWKPLRNETCFRASVPPARIMDFASSANAPGWIADAAFGVVIGRCELNDAARLHKAADGVGGSVIVFDERKRPINFSSDPVVKKILELLKYAFDPDARLNPLPLGEAS
jgi:FAD/FMN-containing dehydrogenase